MKLKRIIQSMLKIKVKMKRKNNNKIILAKNKTN